MRKLLLLVAVAAVVSGCVTTTAAGEKVLVTSNPDTVKGCRLLGQVKGSDHMWGGSAGQGIAEENATAELRNRAAQMGANVVFLSRSSTGFSGSSQLGEAYRCETPSAAPTPSATSS